MELVLREKEPWLRAGVHLICAMPALYLLYTAFMNPPGLGVNPVETLTHDTAIWALRILLVSLAITPIRLVSRWHWLVKLRRPLGLWAFFYALAHFLIYLTFDLQYSVAALADDVLRRPYITVGFAALVLLIPLAVTSTRGWQRKLQRNWVVLHRLVYAIGVLGILHFVWLRKGFQLEPLIYAAILVALLLARPLLWRSAQKKI